jgi:hypothetical protein
MPHPDVRFYPNILVPTDFAVIDTVIRSVLCAGTGKASRTDTEKVARIVLRLYRMGLTDPDKLSELAARLAEKAKIAGSAADRFSSSRTPDSGKAPPCAGPRL